MEFTLKCRQDSSGSDRIEVERDYDGEIRFRLHGGSVFATDDAARTFAHQILALVGDEAPDVTVKVGDVVEILPSGHNSTSAGRVGRVSSIDTDDVPYRIVAQDTGEFIAWAAQVRRTAPTSPHARTSLLAEARREAGDGASPADVLAYAKFLSE